MWKDKHYQFTCLPQGLTSAPRIFTKLLKPVLAHLRKMGMIVSCYIDDCIFIAPSFDELKSNIHYAVSFFDKLGLTVHVSKSSLVPSKEVEYLGCILNSENMTVRLADRKKDKIKNIGLSLLARDEVSIRDLASFIGNVVAADSGVPLAPLRYKQLEIVRNRALLTHKGNYDSMITLPVRARKIISWWINNIHNQSKSISFPPPLMEMFTDASLLGWGAKLGSITTGGQWAFSEIEHINVLELKAVLFALKALCSEHRSIHIRLRIDNTTAVACIERCSSTKEALLAITEDIFTWAYDRDITLSAIHIPGIDNVDADGASRNFNIDTEWMIKPHVFAMLCKVYPKPAMDLFACRLNAQLPKYISWRPDPNACDTDAFTVSWTNGYLYAFPPFSVIGRTLQKIQQDRASVLLVLPLWPTRAWFPRALQMLMDTPRLLPRHSLTLPQDPHRRHSLANKLILVAMPLSGDPSKTRPYHHKLPTSSCPPGDMEHNYNMGAISPSGSLFVASGKLIHFPHL